MKVVFMLFVLLYLNDVISYKANRSKHLLNRGGLKLHVQIANQVQVLSFDQLPNFNGFLIKADTCKCGSVSCSNSENFNLGAESEGEEQNEDVNNTLKNYMLSAIKFYRKALSPLMPPNCRFLPTCSSYGLEAIETYGPWKGGILTAWRILRCNPFGGRGYDPPKWPPPNFFAGSTSRFK